MKKIVSFIILCAVVFSCAACNMYAKKPSSGIWYCDKLKMSINFDIYPENTDCVKLYSEEGTFQTYGCHFDYGNGIVIFQETDGEEEDYLIGHFKYHEKKGQFIIITHPDSEEYIFNSTGDA